jgi:hypothetical protein
MTANVFQRVHFELCLRSGTATMLGEITAYHERPGAFHL